MRFFRLLALLIGVYIGFYFLSFLGAIVAFIVFGYLLYQKPNDWSSQYDVDMTWEEYSKDRELSKDSNWNDSDNNDTFDGGGDSDSGSD